MKLTVDRIEIPTISARSKHLQSAPKRDCDQSGN